jgi:4-alpha-glucanotransferase
MYGVEIYEGHVHVARTHFEGFVPGAGQRAAFGRLLPPEIAAEPEFTPAVRDVVLDLVYGSGSDLLLMPIQDLFGWPDRINTPATVGDRNWRWRLPLSIEELDTDAAARERTAALHELAARNGRL